MTDNLDYFDVAAALPLQASSDPHWTYSARALLAAVVAKVRKTGGDLDDVHRVLSGGLAQLSEYFAEEQGDRERAAIVALVLVYTRWGDG